MKVRKRTNEGKSLQMKVIEPLEFKAKTKDEITLAFTVSFHSTQFNLTLTKAESFQLKCDLDNFLGDEIKELD